MRVLIAEDDVALASFVRKGLEAEHYAVDVSHDGEQTRVMAGELDYDLLMLDLNLPRVDGVSILRPLRTKKPSMPILILTSRNRVEDRVQCLDLGRGRLHGQAVFVCGTLGQNSRVTAQKSCAGGVGAGRRRLEAGPRGAPG
jgi:CheY-like chemotaxis protein